MTTYSRCTTAHHIYKNTYWGVFQTPPNDPGQDIITNRNNFIQEHGIVRHRTRYPNYVYKAFGYKYSFGDGRAYNRFFEHVEVYETPNDYVIISSPYGPSEGHNITVGFTKIPQLYDSNAQTYMAKVKKSPP